MFLFGFFFVVVFSFFFFQFRGDGSMAQKIENRWNRQTCLTPS